MKGRVGHSVEAQLAAWLGADPDDPVQQLALELAREDREFLEHLIAHRRRDLTQAEVAERMGVSQSAVSQFEAGDRDPQMSTVRRYALALGVMVEHRVVEPGRAELIRDDALRAVAELREHSHRTGKDPHDLASAGPSRGLVEVDAHGARLAARAVLP